MHQDQQLRPLVIPFFDIIFGTTFKRFRILWIGFDILCEIADRPHHILTSQNKRDREGKSIRKFSYRATDTQKHFELLR